MASIKRNNGSDGPTAVSDIKRPATLSRAPTSSREDFDPFTAGLRIEQLKSRVSELEDALLQAELNGAQSLKDRVKRLEKDLSTYREARTAAEFDVTDVRASLDRSAAMLESVRASPTYRLGALLITAGQNWRDLIRLPVSLSRWAADSGRHRMMADGQLIKVGSATEYNEAVERALEIAEKRSLQDAERWTLDQRFRAPVVARVFSELARVARRLEPGEAVRLAEAALDADPNEGRVKRLALTMAEAGSVTLAARLMRTAIERGAPFNATEQGRAEELFTLEDLSANGLTLISKAKPLRAVDAVRPRVLIFAPQTFPFHWNSASIRTHAMALALVEADIAVSVVTPPGYPNVGRADPVDYPPMRTIDGVDYHLLLETKAPCRLNDDYLRQTAMMLASLLRRLEVSTLVAPSDLMQGYPAAAAAHLAGASFVLDCWSVAAAEDQCETERDRTFSRIEGQLVDHAKLALARTPAIEARLRQASTKAAICFAPDSLPRAAKPKTGDERAQGDGFVFGYVGDNAPDIDIECLVTVLEKLVQDGVDARLVVHAVGSRIRALRDQLELAGLSSRFKLNEKSPQGRKTELAYAGFDALIVPLRPTGCVLKSPFQIVAALRQHKCVLAIGGEEYREMFGPAVMQTADVDAAAAALSALAKDIDMRRRQEAAARLWDEAHVSAALLVQAFKAV